MKIRITLLVIFVAIFNFLTLAQDLNTFLPKPTGLYLIGTTKLYLTDSSRNDPFKRKEHRKVIVKVWYPCSVKEDRKPEKYLMDYPLDVVYNAFKTKGLLKKWIAELMEYDTHSYPDAIISNRKESFPVLFFNPGFYFGLPDLYVSIMEELASHGYIVCSINHPYEQPYIKINDKELFLKRKRAQWAYLQLMVADMFQWKARESEKQIEEITKYYHKMLHRFNKTVNLWADDTEFVWSYFSKFQGNERHAIIDKMDLESIAVFGQSLGGAVAGELCARNSVFLAGANLDCFQFGKPIVQPIEQPFMLMQSQYNDSWNLGNTINYKENIGDFAFLEFPGSSHFVFSDAAIMPYQSHQTEVSMIGDVNGEEVLSEMLKYLVDFFDFYVKNADPDVIHTDRQLSHLIFSFKKGVQFEKYTTSSFKN